ncbi:Spiroplasmavirus-related protein [Spiroplasma kunkelii CR2-3x]|uniref:Spiroplasmavirus-related protein n=1 Tax=Spiroplasma kunkelii CR2-3x TaxID=273035 RepID=A0A0K2JIF2_SPIKU|nr:Spiroplasmavirus-related protein [Spiroplasma kunkelii CR2-3x]
MHEGWWDFGAHIKNAMIWIVNTIPGVKQVNELASGVGKVFETVYSFFSQIFEVWKFNPALIRPCLENFTSRQHFKKIFSN